MDDTGFVPIAWQSMWVVRRDASSEHGPHTTAREGTPDHDTGARIHRRPPLIRVARLLGSGGYIDTIQVVRQPGTVPDTTGPGTGLFHLDQSWHLLFIFAAALIIGA